MKVIIFVSILCSGFTRIKAPYTPPSGEFLGRYPIEEIFEPSYESPSRGSSSTFRRNPSSFEGFPIGGRIQPNYELEELRRRLEMIRGQFQSISDQLGSRPRPQLPELFTLPPIFSGLDDFSLSPPAYEIPRPRRTLSSRPSPEPLSNSSPSMTPNFGNSYWNPVQCDCGICARRREFRSNSNINREEIEPVPWSNTPPRFPVSTPITTDESSGPPELPEEPSVEPNRPNGSSANPSTGSETIIDPPATSSTSPPVEPDQPSNPSANPDPPKDVPKDKEDEEIEPPKDEIDDSKKPEETPQPESSEKSSKKKPGEEGWEGPETPEEDRPEYYTKDENIKFIQAFTSDMTRLGKYKVAETIHYLLTKKKDELDDYDRAAIRYVVDERLKKDPEIKEALKKYNEKNKNKNTMPPSPNDEPNSDQEIPPSTPPTLSSTNYSPQFRNPIQNEINSDPVANNRQNFGGNIPASSFLPFPPTTIPPSPRPPPAGFEDFPYPIPDNVRRIIEEARRQNPVPFNPPSLPPPPPPQTSFPSFLSSPRRWPRIQQQPEY